MLQQCHTGQLAERLTHLSVCNIQLPSTAEFVNSVSRLFNLEYLLFHQQAEAKLQVVAPVPSKAFHNLLLNLKKLKHLSWEITENPVPLPDDYFYPPDPEDPGKSSVFTAFYNPASEPVYIFFSPEILK